VKLLVCAGNRQIQGGAETYLKSVLPRFAGAGFRVGFLFEKYAPDSEAIDQGADIDEVWRLTPENRDDIWRAINAWSPNVIFNNGMYDSSYEARLTQFPVVYFAHNYAGTCLSGFKRHAWPAPQPCYRTLGFGCLACYYPRRCGGLSPFPVIGDFLFARRQLRMLRSCTQIQVASKAMREEYLRHGFADDRVILNPLFPTNFRPDGTPPGPRGRSGKILLAGRLTSVKGGEYLVKAMHLAQSWLTCALPLQLAVAGDGPEISELRALASRLAVPSQFHGWVGNGELEIILRQADLLAMPSLWPEPFGLLGVEAGCFGVPSVGYAHGGIPDWLVEGDSGTLAPSPPTVPGLAEAILRAVRNPIQYEQMRRGAWEMAQRFTVESHVRRLADVLRSAAASSSSAAHA